MRVQSVWVDMSTATIGAVVDRAQPPGGYRLSIHLVRDALNKNASEQVSG